KAKESFQNKFNDRTKGRFSTDRFEERFRQYITECNKGDDRDSEIDDAFESLVLDITSLDLEGSADKEEQSATYITSFGELTSSEATSVSVALADKPFTYSLMSKDTTKPALS